MAVSHKKSAAVGNHPSKDMRRVFVAVHLPDSVRQALRILQGELRRFDLNIRWTRPETIHLTLKFLGDVPVAGIEGICAAVKRAVKDQPGFTLAARGVGVFPSVRRARVLWTGLSGATDRLTKLQADIDRNLSEIGYPGDDRPFTGHLTLGRFSGVPVPDTLIDLLKACADYGTGNFPADAVHVIQSDLKPGGPVYTDLCGIRFEG